MLFHLPIVYPITDQQRSGLSHSVQVRLLAEGGASLIQLRDKDSSPREFYREAAKALEVARPLGVRIIINDRLDIAQALSADGVHLGQDDVPPWVARRLLGNQAIIGLSTHNLEQALASSECPVDYLALGPIFPTSSKSDAEDVLGLDNVRKVREATRSKPLVAIGGITQANALEVLQAGADAVAVIAALLMDHNRIRERVAEFLTLQPSR